ncbi:hypothetical protein FSP39_012711 [Pinctada imbricata]|uniref:C-type lectin domain-containing protein n=1 Tax=Pinctada imbricata TaxID=66713 RepID=A0AA88XWG5_PINIB|nr:hypothetical protein FSP39_012711 [Pinctada imbricata]
MIPITPNLTDWGTGEPSGGHEHCGDLFGGYDYRWNDSPCDQQRPFICEKKI